MKTKQKIGKYYCKRCKGYVSNYYCHKPNCKEIHLHFPCTFPKPTQQEKKITIDKAMKRAHQLAENEIKKHQQEKTWENRFEAVWSAYFNDNHPARTAIKELFRENIAQSRLEGRREEKERQRKYLQKYENRSKFKRIRLGLCWSCKSKRAKGNSYYCEKHREMHRIRNAERRYKLSVFKDSI